MVSTIFDILFEGFVSVYGVSFFIPLLIIGGFIVLAFRYGLSMLPIGVLLFSGTFLFSLMEYNSVPFLDSYFVILMMLLLGLILGIMFFLFWVRK